MSIEIRSTTGATLFTSSDAATLKEALQEAVTRDADLRDADLRDADLRGAYLRDADLRGADLRGADLRDAYLRDAYLRDADLRDADLRGADLRGADLRGADLRGADLRGADLRGANLQNADLQNADLQNADLQNADLQGAYLLGVYLRDAKNSELSIARTRILPDEGEIIGWKKAKDGRIVKLCIPADARRSHASGRKCRAERAEVIAIFDEDGSSIDTAFSLWDKAFQYVVGQIVESREPFDPDMWNECSSGIHFYITRLEAEHHV